MPVAEAIKNISATLCHTFIDIWESIKEKMPDFEKMKISRKRFVKLLMSIGYQRNEANKIAWRYHEEKGKYTFLDFIIESNQRREYHKSCREPAHFAALSFQAAHGTGK